MESLATIFTEGSGRGLCKRIIAVNKAASMLGLSFLEAFEKQPIELLQLLSLKAQESFEEAHLLVRTHSMPAASIAQILSESFLKVGLLTITCLPTYVQQVFKLGWCNICLNWGMFYPKSGCFIIR